jgi:hypothetical protein
VATLSGRLLTVGASCPDVGALPRGKEANEFFLFLFLQRLPIELRVILGEDPDNNTIALVAKADKL